MPCACASTLSSSMRHRPALEIGSCRHNAPRRPGQSTPGVLHTEPTMQAQHIWRMLSMLCIRCACSPRCPWRHTAPSKFHRGCISQQAQQAQHAHRAALGDTQRLPGLAALHAGHLHAHRGHKGLVGADCGEGRRQCTGHRLDGCGLRTTLQLLQHSRQRDPSRRLEPSRAALCCHCCHQFLFNPKA